ncbi:hypothetical protein QTP70_009492 [Hemibagrus guttatus]|uniref:Peptidase M12B domain-containing protein n=1 Tax=Hemibagrus guttatus TaxID=175788 RepID=A0AAE0R0L3_9TELE|nr:hypothetical protein QTP70_009492 [Hemibagrus guttatus]
MAALLSLFLASVLVDTALLASHISLEKASELLRDVTLGANMRVHLIRMIILTEPEPDIQISDDITSSLKSVCEWGHKVNPSTETDPLHADLLLYITRFDLVLPSGNKQVRGVTQLGGVCSSQRNCVITEDTGFDLGITIAHEIGHSAGKAECVNDVPVLGGSLQEWKPGLYYGVDDQCRIAFGSTATACSFTSNDMATCRFLSCHITPGDRSTCTRLLVPLLDGTECGLNQDFMVSRGAQFIDGTRCELDGPVTPGSVSACLNGECKVFGCDGVLHSGKVEDVCGVCGGKGNTCHLITGSYTGGEAKEYVTFLILPENASQVHINNWNPVFTHMAVLVNDEYVVAGEGDLALNTTHPSPLEENHMVYNLYLTSDLLPHTEELILSGPISDKIQIQVYRKYGREYGDVTSPNITYRYHMLDTEPEDKIIEARWSTVISSCSVTCGSDGKSQSLVSVQLCVVQVRLADQCPASVPTVALTWRWQVGEQGPCSVSCNLGVALRRVSCVQFDGKLEKEVEDEHCEEGKMPPLTVPCFTQACSFHWGVQEWSECSVSCGYGIQSRTVSCLGPSSPLPITPILCVHLPKPITIQACYSANCSTPGSNTTPTQEPDAWNKTTTLKILPEKRSTYAPPGDTEKLPEVLPTVPVLRTTTALSTEPPQSSLCGQLVLQDTGIIDLRNVSERRCFISIGRPLDEVIQIKIESSSLNCRQKENLALYERKSLRQICEKIAGKTLTSRSNVLLVRQSRLTLGNGVLLSYQSKKNMKRSHHEDCNVQLFSPTGLIENPIRRSSSSSSSTLQSCRVFIDAPPSLKIEIRALSVLNTTSSDSAYVL